MLWRQRWRRVVAVRSKRCVTTLWAIITAGCRVSWSDCEIPRHAGKNMLEYYWLDQTAGTRPRLHTVLRNGCMLVVMPCIQSMSTRSITLRLHIDLNPRRMIHQTKQAGTHLASRPSLHYKYGHCPIQSWARPSEALGCFLGVAWRHVSVTLPNLWLSLLF